MAGSQWQGPLCSYWVLRVTIAQIGMLRFSISTPTRDLGRKAPARPPQWHSGAGSRNGQEHLARKHRDEVNLDAQHVARFLEADAKINFAFHCQLLRD